MLFMKNETDGQLDEVRIFNRILPPDEIRRGTGSGLDI